MGIVNPIVKSVALQRTVGIGAAALAAVVASVSSAYAHGGMAGPSELGPPLITSGALGLVCYWLVMLWPSSKSGRGAKPGARNGVAKDARLGDQSASRDSGRTEQTPRSRKVEGRLQFNRESSRRRDVNDA